MFTRVFAGTSLFLFACLTAGCLSPSSQPPWTPLFNGKDLTGWMVKCAPRDAGRTFWRVDDGTILADSMGCKDHDYVWLATTREYADFELRLRFQTYRESPGNSGVQIRSRYDDAASWLDGPQIDINPPGPWRTGMMWDETRGNHRWIHPDLPADKWVDASMAPAGLTFKYDSDGDGWNTLDIKAVGPQITALLNGVQVTNFDGKTLLCDDTHRRRRNVGEKGVIALQIHRGDELKIRFSDVLIRDLTPSFDPLAAGH